jgi:hypothetical protein
VKLNLSNTHLNDAHLVHVASTHLVSAGRPPPNCWLSLLLSAHSLYLRVVHAELARLRELKVARNVDITNIGANDSIASTNPQQARPKLEHLFNYLLLH